MTLSRWTGGLGTGPFRFAPGEAPAVRIRRVIVPEGPCAYLRRAIPDEEWAEWETVHGAEAADRARRFQAEYAGEVAP
ncbi:MAG: hypothetical protein WD960_15075 [Gemmatimonadota bacterium]